MTHALAPCPFCGAEMIEYAGSDSFFHSGTVADPGCLLNGRGFNPDDADSWNDRATSPREKALEEAVDAWMANPCPATEQNIMDARALLEEGR